MAKKKQSKKSKPSRKSALPRAGAKASTGRARPAARPAAKAKVKVKVKVKVKANKPAAARRLKRPTVLKGDRDNYVLVLTDAPDRVDGYELAQLLCDGNEGAGDITPPTGLGKSIFHQDLMDDTFGDVPIDTCRKGLTELKGIIRDHVSALGFEKGGKVYELSEVDFLAAVQDGRWKFIKFVHVEDE
jgi:hypothetical protein